MLFLTLKKHWIKISTIIVLLLICFIFFQDAHNKKPDLRGLHATLLREPRLVNQFSLQATDNKPFTQHSLEKQWTLVFFGFTHCSLLCPTTMAELDKMYRFLQIKKAPVLPHVVMITLDPEQDSLSRLRQYVKAFNPNFSGARGSEKEIDAMTREFGIAYAKISNQTKKDSSQQDNIEHTGAILLFNPQGNLTAFFTTPHNAEIMANDFMLLTA